MKRLLNWKGQNDFRCISVKRGHFYILALQLLVLKYTQGSLSLLKAHFSLEVLWDETLAKLVEIVLGYTKASSARESFTWFPVRNSDAKMCIKIRKRIFSWLLKSAYRQNKALNPYTVCRVRFKQCQSLQKAILST